MVTLREQNLRSSMRPYLNRAVLTALWTVPTRRLDLTVRFSAKMMKSPQVEAMAE